MVIDGDELRPRPSQIKDELKDSQIDELELSKTNDEFKPSQEMTTAKFVEQQSSSNYGHPDDELFIRQVISSFDLKHHMKISHKVLHKLMI